MHETRCCRVFSYMYKLASILNTIKILEEAQLVPVQLAHGKPHDC